MDPFIDYCKNIYTIALLEEMFSLIFRKHTREGNQITQIEIRDNWTSLARVTEIRQFEVANETVDLHFDPVSYAFRIGQYNCELPQNSPTVRYGITPTQSQEEQPQLFV